MSEEAHLEAHTGLHADATAAPATVSLANLPTLAEVKEAVNLLDEAVKIADEIDPNLPGMSLALEVLTKVEAALAKV
jgi:hypothetical protein